MTDPEIVDLERQPTAAIRVTQPMAELDLASAFDRGIPLVAERVIAAGGSLAGPPYGRYHAFGPAVPFLTGREHRRPRARPRHGSPAAEALDDGDLRVRIGR